MDLSKLASAQRDYLKAGENLYPLVEEVIVPMLAKCKTGNDVMTLRKDVRDLLDCSLDGPIDTSFAIAFSVRDV